MEIKMKILVFHLGGTISCVEENGVLVPNADIKGEFRTIATQFNDVTFEHKNPKPFLSEYLNGSRIGTIVKDVKKAIASKKYDGIILTHGSDTVAYTASALAYALGNNCIPVVLVCSELPISDPASSGKINLCAAVALIVSGNAKGVFAVYKAGATDATVYRATRLLRHKAYEKELSCVGQPYGKVTFSAPANAIFHKNPSYSEGVDELPPIEARFRKTSPIMHILVYPGMSRPKLSLGCKAVILSSYHSGTVDTESEELLRFARKCKRKNIPVFVDGIGEGKSYESMQKYEAFGFKRLPANTSPVAMYMKLWMLISGGLGTDNLPLSLGGDLQKQPSKK
jgi:L-asparaginase